MKGFKWLVTQKFYFFVGFPTSVQDFFLVYNMFLVTCMSLQLFRFQIDQFIPFCMETPRNPQKKSNL